MTIQRTDVFHCLKCGRMVYQAHGAPTPSCCREMMFCAVANFEGQIPATKVVPETDRGKAIGQDSHLSEMADTSH